jgi:hypothetical protein
MSRRLAVRRDIRLLRGSSHSPHAAAHAFVSWQISVARLQMLDGIFTALVIGPELVLPSQYRPKPARAIP